MIYFFLSVPLKYNRLILFCYDSDADKFFYAVPLKNSGFLPSYFQKGGLTEKYRKMIWNHKLRSVDRDFHWYSVFAKVETGNFSLIFMFTYRDTFAYN